MTQTSPERDDPVVPAMRWLLGLAAVLVFLAGVQLFLFPVDTGPGSPGPSPSR